MSKKTLLNETQVRRFMKLANVGTLSDGFVDGLEEAGYFRPVAEQGEDELGELPGDEGPVEDEVALDAEVPVEDELGDDLGGEEDLGLDDAAGGAELPPEVVAQVEDALASALGAMEQELEAAIPELDLSVEREGEEELGGEEDLGGDEELADLGGEEELAPEDDLGGDDLGGDEELAPEDELVERIARKVALRLRNAVKK